MPIPNAYNDQDGIYASQLTQGMTFPAIMQYMLNDLARHQRRVAKIAEYIHDSSAPPGDESISLYDRLVSIDTSLGLIFGMFTVEGNSPNTDEPRPLVPVLVELLQNISTEVTLKKIHDAIGSEPNTDEPRPLVPVLVELLQNISTEVTLKKIHDAIGQEPNTDEPRPLAHLLSILPAQICECLPTGGSGDGDATPLLPPAAEEADSAMEKTEKEKCQIAHLAIEALRDKAKMLAIDYLGVEGESPGSNIGELTTLLNLTEPQLFLSPTQLLDILFELGELGADAVYLGDLLEGDFSTYNQFLCAIVSADSPASAHADARAALEFANYWVGGTQMPRPKQIQFVRIYTTMLSPSFVQKMWDLELYETDQVTSPDGQQYPSRYPAYKYTCDCSSASDDPDDPIPPEEASPCDGTDYISQDNGKLYYYTDPGATQWRFKSVSFVNWENWGLTDISRPSRGWGLPSGHPISATEAGIIHIRLVAQTDGPWDVQSGCNAPGATRMPSGDKYARLKGGDYETCYSFLADEGDVLWIWSTSNKQFTVELTMGESETEPQPGCTGGIEATSLPSTTWGYSQFSGWSTSIRGAIQWPGGEDRQDDKWGISPAGGLVIPHAAKLYVQLLTNETGYNVRIAYGPLTAAAPPYYDMPKDDFTTCHEVDLVAGDRLYIRGQGNANAFSVRYRIIEAEPQ